MVHLTSCIVDDLKALATLLAIHQPASHAWSRPIGLLIPCIPHFTCLSDASYEGLRGWSPQLHFMWHVTTHELRSLGFPMVAGSEPSPLDPPNALHINTLEFLALTVNIWFALSFCSHNDPQHCHDHIGNFLADNTSALSWMCHAGHTRTPWSHCLARFLQALLTFTPLPFQFQSNHISGLSNDTADILSRPSHAQLWASAISGCPQDLLPCKPYLMPCKLLSALHDCIANTENMAMSAGEPIAFILADF